MSYFEANMSGLVGLTIEYANRHNTPRQTANWRLIPAYLKPLERSPITSTGSSTLLGFLSN